MSAGSKKAKKELYGHPAVLGNDVLSVGATALSGVVGHSIQNAGVSGCNRFVLPRGGYLNYIVANVSPTMTAGSLEVAVHKNGVAVFSGVLSTSAPDRVDNFFQLDNGNAVTVASGDVIQGFYAVSSALAPGTALRSLNTRMGITYRE